MLALKNLVLQELKELDAADIRAGLAAVSKYIPHTHDYPGRAIHVVVIGGALSVLVLQTRKTTKDIDYFVIEPTCTHLGIVGDASRMADKKETKRYPRAWINSDVVAIVNRGDLGAYEDSLRQNEVIFQSDTLVVYAADWRYQLVNKMSRAHEVACERGDYENDLADAVAIAYRLVAKFQRPIPKSRLVTWYMAGHAMEDDAIDVLNCAYYAKYHTLAIDTTQ